MAVQTHGLEHGVRRSVNKKAPSCPEVDHRLTPFVRSLPGLSGRRQRPGRSHGVMGSNPTGGTQGYRSKQDTNTGVHRIQIQENTGYKYRRKPDTNTGEHRIQILENTGHNTGVSEKYIRPYEFQKLPNTNKSVLDTKSF